MIRAFDEISGRAKLRVKVNSKWLPDSKPHSESSLVNWVERRRSKSRCVLVVSTQTLNED